MYSSSGADARSSAPPNARDSSSSMPPDHLCSLDRQAFGREKFDRADRDRHVAGKKEWASDRSSSGQASHRPSSVLSVNGNLSGPSSKRQAIGRYGVVGENGRYGAAGGRCAESSSLRGTSSPVENGKVERDGSSLSGGPSPGYSGSPGSERFYKDSDGHHFRESCLSPSEGRPSSSPRLEALSRAHGSQSTTEAVGSRDRERPKFGSSVSWDAPQRERESRERLSKPEVYRRAGTILKLDSGSDWSPGDRELVGRLDRYGSSSIREHVSLDVLGGRKEQSRHDWRARDRSLLSPFSSRVPTYSSNNCYAKDTTAPSIGSEVAGITKSPNQSPLEISSAQESSLDDSVLISPRKRPRLTWGQGLAKYEKEKVEEVPATAKKSTESPSNSLNASFQGDARTEPEQIVSSIHSGNLLATNNTNSLPPSHEDPGTDFVEPSSKEVHEEPSSGLHDSVISFSCEEITVTEKCSDEKNDNFNPPDALAHGLSSSVSEKLISAVTAFQVLVPEDSQALTPKASEISSSVSKDFLMQKIEKVEFEIDAVEKELVKLEIEYGNQRDEHATQNNMPPENSWLSSQAEVPHKQHEDAASPVCDIHMVTDRGKSIDSSAPCLEDQQDDLGECGRDIGQSSDHLTEVLARETIPIHVETETGKCTPDFGTVNLNVTNGNLDVECPNAESLDTKDIDMGEQDVSVKREDYVSQLLKMNLETAKSSFDSLAHMLPEGDPLRTRVSCDNRKLHDSLHDVVVWNFTCKNNERQTKLLESKVAEEQGASRFIEKVLAARYRALRESWNKEQLGNGQRKERVKAGRHGELDHRNGSAPPSLRTSARLRSVTGSTVPDAVCEEVQVIRKLWSEPQQIDCQRAYLRMPSMLLNDQERALHKFVTSNALVEDAVAVEQERKSMNPWSCEERKIFLDKYSLYGKNFSKVSSFLQHKTVADCVEFYYRNQKSEDFDKVRRRLQLKKRRDNSRSSSYLATTTSFNSRHREVNAARVEGLTLVAEAAAAMSGQRDFSKVVRSANKLIERTHYLPGELGMSDALSKLASDKSIVNDGTLLFSFSSVASSSAAVNNANLKTYRDRNLSRQGSNVTVPVGKGSHGELQSGVKGARSVHARSFKGSSEELDSQWTDSERELFTEAVALFGKDFHSISLHIGSKSQGQCKAFFSKTRKRLGLDKLVECHKANVQSVTLNDAKTIVPSVDIKSLHNVEEVVDEEMMHVYPKPLAVQGAEAGYREEAEEEARAGEKLLNVEGSLSGELNAVTEVQAVNAVPKEHDAVGQSPVISAPRLPQTGTKVMPDDVVLPDISEPCIILPSSSNNAVKEVCAVENGSVSCTGSKDASSGKDPPADVVQSCFPEASLVCAETLQFKTEPVCVKSEPVTVPSVVQETSNTMPSHEPLSGASQAMSVLSSGSLTANAVSLPATVKDRGIKATETKTRREPTSWTQEEKEKFVDIIRKHGKNWDRLRENLPAKSLTQIKTYFQNSKAKLGLAPEGTGSSAGRGGSSRKRKADDSDSSSNAGSGGQMVSQKVILHADEGSLKVNPSVLGPTGGLGSNIVGPETLAYASIFGRNSSQAPEDPINAQKVFHSIGLAQNSSASAMIPMFNATGFSTPSLRPVQQSFVHPTLKTQQLVNHQQPQTSFTPLVVVQALQQQTTAAGIHQVHQLQPQQAIARTQQDLPIPVVQHLHKQAPPQPQQSNSQALLQQQQQQQIVQHMQQREAVLQQKLQPQLIQRQQQQQQQQLQLTAQQVQHHLQQVLSHHQTQTHQQSSPQNVNQQPQGPPDQLVGHQQVTGSQPKASSLQHQQSGQFLCQFYQINSKSQPLLQPQPTTQQQLQQLQLHLQQHQLQVQRQQQQAHPQQVQVQKQIPGSPQLQQQQQQGFHLLFEQPHQQQLALLRETLQPSCANSEVSKHSEPDIQNPAKCQPVACDDLQQPPPSAAQASDQGPPKSQVSSEALARSGDVKLFGQSLLVQPGSGLQPTNCKVSSTTSSQVVASNSLSSSKATSDGLSKGQGTLAGPSVQGHGRQVVWPGVPVGSSGSGSSMVSILQGSSTGRSLESESESHGAQEAVARMNERLIREARDLEDGRMGDLAALSHLARLQDSWSLSSVLPSLDSSVLSDAATVQCMLSAEAKKLDNESKRNDQLGVSDRGTQLSKSRGSDLTSLSSTMPLSQLAASQGLPRVLDALVALGEWRLQQSNSSCSRLTEEFFSQSWEALRRDPASLAEAGKSNESLAQAHVGGPEMLQHSRDSVFYPQPHLMHLQQHSGVGGGAWGSSSMIPMGETQHVLAPPSSSFRSHNVPHNPASSDEQARVETRDLDSSGGAVG